MNTTIRSATEFPSARGTPSIVQKDKALDSTSSQPIQQDSLRTILLVSSDDYLRPMIRAYLEHVGFAVISCTNLDSASEIVSRRQAIQLLIIDLDSSGSQGLEPALELTGARAGLATVIVAGPQPADHQMRMIESHTWKMLRKPIRLPELLAEIQGVFARQRLNVPAQLPLHAQPTPLPRANALRPASAPSARASKSLLPIRRKAEGEIR